VLCCGSSWLSVFEMAIVSDGSLWLYWFCYAAELGGMRLAGCAVVARSVRGTLPFVRVWCANIASSA
jgi:hypothetical protein